MILLFELFLFSGKIWKSLRHTLSCKTNSSWTEWSFLFLQYRGPFGKKQWFSSVPIWVTMCMYMHTYILKHLFMVWLTETFKLCNWHSKVTEHFFYSPIYITDNFFSPDYIIFLASTLSESVLSNHISRNCF